MVAKSVGVGTGGGTGGCTIWQFTPGIGSAPTFALAPPAPSANDVVIGIGTGHGGSGPSPLAKSSSSLRMVPGPTSSNCVEPSASSDLNLTTAAAVLAP